MTTVTQSCFTGFKILFMSLNGLNLCRRIKSFKLLKKTENTWKKLYLKNIQKCSDESIRQLAHTLIYTHIFYSTWPTKLHTSRELIDAHSSSLWPTDCFVWEIKKKGQAEQHVNIPEAESGSDYLDETLSDRNTTAVDKIKTHTHTKLPPLTAHT